MNAQTDIDTPEGWAPVTLADGSIAFERDAYPDEGFAIIDTDGREFVLASSAEDARRIDRETLRRSPKTT